MSMPKDKVASLPAVPPVADPQLRSFLTALKMWVDAREPATGIDESSFVRFGDIVNANLATINQNPGRGGFGLNPFPSPPPASSGPPPDLTVPPAPTAVAAAGAFTNILITWDLPVYGNHSHAEVWRSAVDDLGTAQLIGTSVSFIYADATGEGRAYYYWVRFVSTAGVRGPYQGIAGIFGQTALNVNQILEELAGSITESELFQSLQTRLNGIEANAAAILQEESIRALDDGRLFAQYTVKIDNRGYLSGFGLASTSPDADTGTPGFSEFYIRADRFAIASPFDTNRVEPQEANIPFIVTTTPQTINGVLVPPGVYMKDAYIRNGSIVNAKIGFAAVDTAQIAQAAIKEAQIDDLAVTSAKVGNVIESNNFSPGVSGWRIRKDGVAEFNTVAVRGYMTGGAFTGYEWPASGSGFYLGPEGLLLGNQSTSQNYFRFDTATGLLALGGALINGGTFTGPGFPASGGGFHLSPGGLYLRGNNVNSGFMLFETELGQFALGRNNQVRIVLDDSGRLILLGDLMGGAFTGYEWPMDGGTGYFLGTGGLLLGNPFSGSGGYVQVNSETGVFEAGYRAGGLVSSPLDFIRVDQFGARSNKFYGFDLLADRLTINGASWQTPGIKTGGFSSNWGPFVTIRNAIANQAVMVIAYLNESIQSSFFSGGTVSLHQGFFGGPVLVTNTPAFTLDVNSNYQFKSHTIVAMFVPPANGDYSFHLNSDYATSATIAVMNAFNPQA